MGEFIRGDAAPEEQDPLVFLFFFALFSLIALLASRIPAGEVILSPCQSQEFMRTGIDDVVSGPLHLSGVR